jgi:hypothetical protein
MFDVLFLTYDDNANTGYRFWQCARSLGLNVAMFKGKTHDFGYPNQAPLHPSLMHEPLCVFPTTIMAPGIESLINSSKVIHLIASTYPMAAVDWKKKKVIVQHGGSVYRQNPKASNDFFNRFVDKTVIQCPDLLGLGAKDETLIYYPIDTDLIKPDFKKKGDKLVVGHFPSNQDVKGTDAICQVVADLGEKIEYRGVWPGENKLKSWPANLNRMKECDVIIESLSPEQDGKVFGEFGNTALEACALGCVCVSNCLKQDVYRREYGDLGIHVANCSESLKEEILRLSRLDDEHLLMEKRDCYKWVSEKHSIPATAKRLWDKVYSRYFDV